MIATKGHLVSVRADLVKAIGVNGSDAELDEAFWMVDRALAGKAEFGVALEYAITVLRRVGLYEAPKVVIAPARTISKAEHDAMLSSDAPKSVSREDYERMMREAQE